MKHFCKTILVLIIFLNVVNEKAFSQYQPMLKDGAKWQMCLVFEPGCNYSYQITGDSIVDGINYKILTGDTGCMWPAPVYLLKEDTATKKVYFDTCSECLLYDYGMSVGDTALINGTPLVLDSITNSLVLFDDLGSFIAPSISPLKVFYLHDIVNWGGPIIWVEGIGCLTDIMLPYVPRYSYCMTMVLCHFDGSGTRDFHFWPDSFVGYSDSCEGPFSDVNEFRSNFQFNVYPNPSTNSIIIEIKRGLKMNETVLSICDIHGRVLIQEHLKQEKSIIDLTKFAKGIYFLKLNNEGESKVVKILKE